MIVQAIHKEMEKAIRRKWEKIYVFIDFHEIIMKPNYDDNETLEYYPFAKELLQHLSARDDICLCTWTCSHPHQITGYLTKMFEDGIKFQFINKNPEVKSDRAYGSYETKPYYNILIDDKAGVMPEELEGILEAFKQYRL